MERYHDLYFSIFYQSSKQQKQASNAITIYYSSLRTDSKKSYSDFNALNNSVNGNIPDYNKDLLDKDKPLNNQIQPSLPVQSSNFRNQTNTANLQESDNHERAIGWRYYVRVVKLLIKFKCLFNYRRLECAYSESFPQTFSKY